MENERQRQYKNDVIKQLGLKKSQLNLQLQLQDAQKSSQSDKPKKKQIVIKPAPQKERKRKRERQEFVDEQAGVTVKQELWTLNVVKNEPDAPIAISSEEEVVEVPQPPPPAARNIKPEYDAGAGPSSAPHQPPMDFDMSQYFEDEPEEKPILPWFPPEYGKVTSSTHRNKKGKKAKAEFQRHMEERPWATDKDEIDITEVMGPSASIPKVTGSTQKQRPCWLRLRRKWLVKNFLKHFIASSNIRFRGTTFASLCHHPTSNWDCHPLCWQCYWELDLPLCGLLANIDCPHCKVMGVKARQARARKLRALTGDNPQKVLRQYSNKTGLPANIYTQVDADEWMRAKDQIQMPNPDWLRTDQPVGSCFPAKLIPFGTSVREAVAANPKWKSGNYSKHVSLHNSSKRKQKPDPETTSEKNGIYIPRCLMWGAKEHSERDLQFREGIQKAKDFAHNIERKEDGVAQLLKSQNEFLRELTAQLKKSQQPSDVAKIPEQEQTQTAQDLQSIVENLTDDDLNVVLGELPGLKSGQRTPEELKSLSKEQLMKLVASLKRKLEKQEQEQEDEDRRLSSRASSVDPRLRRDTTKTPTEEQQEVPPPTIQQYGEKAMFVRDWNKRIYPAFCSDIIPKVPPTSAVQMLLEDLHKLGVEMDFSEYEGITEDGEQRTFHLPQIQPRFLAQLWEEMANLQHQDPFELRTHMPHEVGLMHGVEPHYRFEAWEFQPDHRGKYPDSQDCLLTRYSESEQLRKLTSATGAFNNIAAAANRALSMRLEDLSTPLEPERKIERLLVSLVREATDMVNKLTAKASVLSTAILRRDSMLRANQDPTTHSAAFATPFNRTQNFDKAMGSY